MLTESMYSRYNNHFGFWKTSIYNYKVRRVNTSNLYKVLDNILTYTFKYQNKRWPQKSTKYLYNLDVNM